MAGKKKALGRGLDALFGEMDLKMPVFDGDENRASEEKAENPSKKPQENAVLYVSIDDIKPNTMQPRQNFPSEEIEELAASIETYGVIQPVILKETDTGFELIAGERRWRAARKAGLKTVPALLRKVSDEENALIALIENMQRVDLNTIEEATQFKLIIEKFGMTQEALARVVGKSRTLITNTLRTLSLPEEIIEMLRQGSLTLGHANALGKIKEKGKQIKLAERIAKNGLSVREAEGLADIAAQKTEKKKKPKDQKSSEIQMIEQELTSATGVRVIINGTGEKGSVELRYFDRPGLEEIIDMLREARVKN